MGPRARYPRILHKNQRDPYQGLFQTLKIERGNGFVKRVESGAGVQSPYNAEMVR